MALSSSSI